MTASPIVNRADVPEREVSHGDIAFARRRLGAAAGVQRIGASLYAVPAGARQMPVHVHGDEEEIIFVLSGGGLGYELEGQDPDGPAHVYPIAAGDTIVHRPEARPHTCVAGDGGLELIAFGSGSDTSITFLPRARAMWCGPRWVPLDAPHPFRAEALAGPLEPPSVDAAAPRPAHVVALQDVDAVPFPGAEVRAVGHAAGSVKAGLKHVTLAPGTRGARPHCHTLEEELFVVLNGGGTLTLGDAQHPLRAGDVIARPPATGVCHALTAGPDGLTYLAYGTREPGDAVYYPEAGQVRLRGLGVTLDVAAPTTP
jgi:uncharacterized cupin superfamily protein